MTARVVRGDVVRFCRLHKALGLPRFHAALMDVPYELGGKVSIDDALNVSKVGSGGGFMSAAWDDTGVAFDPETWRAIAATLLPGAYLFVFAGNLNDDLISVAMRRAGLVKQHKALAWANGSSLPKTTQISTQVDKTAGEKGTYGDYRSIAHVTKPRSSTKGMDKGWQRPWQDDEEARERNARVYEPATPLAQTWAGHRYGSQAFRNLIEAILIFRKPYEGRPVDSIVEHGSGALNIEGSRIGTGEEDTRRSSKGGENGLLGTSTFKIRERRVDDKPQSSGRHPANFVISHTTFPVRFLSDTTDTLTAAYIKGYLDGYRRVADLRTLGGVDAPESDTLEVIAQDIPEPWLEYFTETKEDLGCTRRGTKRVRNSSGKASGPTRDTWGWNKEPGSGRGEIPFYADADGLESVDDFECARDESGRFICPVALLDEQAGDVGGSPQTSGSVETTTGDIYGKYKSGRSMVSHNDTGGPSRFIFTSDYRHEQHYAAATEQRIQDANAVRYQSKPSKAERDAGLDGFEEVRAMNYSGLTGGRNPDNPKGAFGGARKRMEQGLPSSLPRRNSHPTVKSISLMKYLAGLLLPPDAYAPRRILIPFSGSGSECIAAALAGWEEIVGVELERDYVAIAKARIAWWEKQSSFGQTDPAVILANAPPEANEAGDVQIDMFKGES